MINKGIIITAKGIIIVLINQPNISFFPGKCNFANAYPDIE
jgi:hypothetical protein